MTFSPNQSCDALVTGGAPTYSTHWNAWQDIGVVFGMALIPLVTWSLLSPQKAGLMMCAVSPLISLGRSHHFSDVGFLSVTLGSGHQIGLGALGIWVFINLVDWTTDIVPFFIFLYNIIVIIYFKHCQENIKNKVLIFFYKKQKNNLILKN